MTLLYRFAAAALIAGLPLLAPTADAAAAKKAAPKKPAAKAAPKTSPIAIQPLSHDEKNGFSVLQIAVPDSAKFIAAWKLGQGAQNATTKTVANQPLFTFLIFRGCKANAQGNCDIVADFVIHRPDGTTNDENKGVTVWNKTAPTDVKKPYLGDGALGYGTDDEGPFGEYRVVATITDRVAGTTLTTEQTLTIAAGTDAKPDAAKPDDAKPSDAATPDAAPPATDSPAKRSGKNSR